MMRSTPTARARLVAMSSVIAGGAIVFMAGAGLRAGPELAASQAPQSNFVGGNPTQLDAKAIRTLRLEFPAGSRSNWHSHANGQLLMVEKGRGRTQERGGALREMLPGQPWYTKPGVEHWHGAAPDQAVEQLTIYEGDVKWLEPVSDEIYKAAPQRK